VVTRRLRPPLPLEVRCQADGLPSEVYRGGRRRAVTHVAATWVLPALWWAADEDGGNGDGDARDAGQPGRAPTPPTSERTCFRLVIESGQVLEAFRATDGRFWLERIID